MKPDIFTRLSAFDFLKGSSNTFYNVPGACLLNRSPVPAMVVNSSRSGLLMV